MCIIQSLNLLQRQMMQNSELEPLVKKEAPSRKAIGFWGRASKELITEPMDNAIQVYSGILPIISQFYKPNMELAGVVAAGMMIGFMAPFFEHLPQSHKMNKLASIISFSHRAVVPFIGNVGFTWYAFLSLLPVLKLQNPTNYKLFTVLLSVLLSTAETSISYNKDAIYEENPGTKKKVFMGSVNAISAGLQAPTCLGPFQLQGFEDVNPTSPLSIALMGIGVSASIVSSVTHQPKVKFVASLILKNLSTLMYGAYAFNFGMDMYAAGNKAHEVSDGFFIGAIITVALYMTLVTAIDIVDLKEAYQHDMEKLGHKAPDEEKIFLTVPSNRKSTFTPLSMDDNTSFQLN
jgi:hypothetical protein